VQAAAVRPLDLISLKVSCTLSSEADLIKSALHTSSSHAEECAPVTRQRRMQLPSSAPLQPRGTREVLARSSLKTADLRGRIVESVVSSGFADVLSSRAVSGATPPAAAPSAGAPVGRLWEGAAVLGPISPRHQLSVASGGRSRREMWRKRR